MRSLRILDLLLGEKDIEWIHVINLVGESFEKFCYGVLQDRLHFSCNVSPVLIQKAVHGIT